MNFQLPDNLIIRNPHRFMFFYTIDVKAINIGDIQYIFLSLSYQKNIDNNRLLSVFLQLSRYLYLSGKNSSLTIQEIFKLCRVCSTWTQKHTRRTRQTKWTHRSCTNNACVSTLHTCYTHVGKWRKFHLSWINAIAQHVCLWTSC